MSRASSSTPSADWTGVGAGIRAMREQYGEIVELSRLDNVTVQILPNAVVTHRALVNFGMLNFPDELEPMVQTDLPNTISVTDARREVSRAARRFDAMRESALAPAETADFLYRLTHDWKKSSYSDDQGGSCVEIAPLTNVVGIRDSKDRTGPALVLPKSAWSAFVAHAQDSAYVVSLTD